MQAITDEQIAELLTVAQGDVSYQSMYSRTTAKIANELGVSRWIRKQYARDYLNELIEAERKAAYVAPIAPTVAPGPRSQSYTGPFPRGKHSHRCRGCETRGQFNAVACYKSKCTKPQLTATCEWCRKYFAQ